MQIISIKNSDWYQNSLIGFIIIRYLKPFNQWIYMPLFKDKILQLRRKDTTLRFRFGILRLLSLFCVLINKYVVITEKQAFPFD